MSSQNIGMITAEDLYRFQLIIDCQISPGGQYVVYCVQRVDKTTEKKYSNLWLASTNGGKGRQLTFGDYADSQPRWSPDGCRIAILSDRGKEMQSQIYVIALGGAEVRRVTDMNGTFGTAGRLPDGTQLGTLEWSPDGRRIVFQFRKQDQEDVEREKDADKKKLGIAARHITRTFYKSEGVGYLPLERWHIWSVDVENGTSMQLTDGATYDEAAPCWAPDGKTIVFCSNRCNDPDLDPEAIDLYVTTGMGGPIRKIIAPYGIKQLPSFSPDGLWIAYVGHDGQGEGWKNNSLWIVPTDSQGPARNLTGKFDLHVASFTIDDMCSPTLTPPTWSKDGKTVYFQVARHGNIILMSISLAGDDPETIIEDRGAVRLYGLDEDQQRLLYLHSDLCDPGQVWVRNVSTGRSRKLTSINEELLQGVDLGEVEEVWFKGIDENHLHGWIFKPPGFCSSHTYPALLQIHGGPMEQFGNFFYHEFYNLTSNGYVVFCCNPRGSQGYGEEHCKTTWGAWATADYDDLMAWTDYVAQKPYIDEELLGVAGGSYGGYMTNWIIGHTDRFKAAVTTRCVSNFISMWGCSDINWTFQRSLDDQPPWQNVGRYWERSPMKYIGNAKTPTLIIHSEQDLRCSLEQAEQVFVALKTLGVDTELVIFPDEGHGLARGGRTDRRIIRLNHMLRWLDTYVTKNYSQQGEIPSE